VGEEGGGRRGDVVQWAVGGSEVTGDDVHAGGKTLGGWGEEGLKEKGVE